MINCLIGYSVKELLIHSLIEHLFSEFKSFLEAKGLIFNEGQLIDASFTVAPRQRNILLSNTLWYY